MVTVDILQTIGQYHQELDQFVKKKSRTSFIFAQGEVSTLAIAFGPIAFG